MGKTNVEMTSCDQCGRADRGMVTYTCPLCGMEVCTYCLDTWQFPLDRMWLHICKQCLEREDAKAFMALVEKNWRRLQSRLKKEMDKLPRKKNKSWEERQAEMEARFKHLEEKKDGEA